MDTIEYQTRSDMEAALREAHKQGIQVDVIENGRTLRYPNGIGEISEEDRAALEQEEADTAAEITAAQSTEDESLVGVVQPQEEEEGEPEPAEEEDLIGEPKQETRQSSKRGKRK